MPTVEPIEGRVLEWLKTVTWGKHSVLELGAGRFEKLAAINSSLRVGIEICQQYIDEFPAPGVRQICGDMREFDVVLKDNGIEREWDCVLMIDALEHISFEDGVPLLAKLKRHTKSICVFCPLGCYEQHDDPWGYNNPHQAHKSEWWPADFERLGFQSVVEHPGFHSPEQGAIFAQWNRHDS